jgi:hypothetical protein
MRIRNSDIYLAGIKLAGSAADGPEDVSFTLT